MKAFKKQIILLLVLVNLGSIIPSVNVFASEANNYDFHSHSKDEMNNFKTVEPSKKQLKNIGLTEEETQLYLNTKKTGIVLHNGEAYDKYDNLLADGQHRVKRGKLSWAAWTVSKGLTLLI